MDVTVTVGVDVGVDIVEVGVGVGVAVSVGVGDAVGIDGVADGGDSLIHPEKITKIPIITKNVRKPPFLLFFII